MTVAIDGPAGTGKSTIAKEVASRAGFLYLNSGNVYRALTWRILQSPHTRSRMLDREDPQTREAAIRVSEQAKVEIDSGGITIDGQRPGAELRSTEVNRNVAEVSSIPEVRNAVNKFLLTVANARDVVAEGRDMATVVFPHADVKVYLDASLEARAKRRFGEQFEPTTLEETMKEIEKRDKIDATKAVGRLKVHPSALYINTSDLTVNQVCDNVLRAILRKKPRNRSN